MSLLAVEETRDVRIPSASGTLSADVIRPADVAAVPTLLTVLPYRKDLDLFWHDLMRWFAARGYACVLVDLSGTGRSDGVAAPKMSPEEARDSSAALDWIVAQPWSDGGVGMWGMSSGGFTTLRAAEVGHPALRAVIPMLSPLRPDADAFHHDGARTDLHQRMLWSAQLLVQQWLPPAGEVRPRDLRRWEERLEHDPFFLDFVRHDAGDPELSRRAIDVSRIRVPALCIGGWRDLYARSMVELYERLDVPKRLIMGPWFHRGPRLEEGLPEIALEWWDHWLLGGPALSGSPVQCAILGGGWGGFDSWPPPQVSRQRLVAVGGGAVGDAGVLARDETVVSASVSHVVPSNATVGTLTGSWGMPSAGEVLPADQTVDDRHCLRLDSAGVGRDAVLAGVATVEFEVAADEPLPTRIVARLCRVRDDGVSELITTGTCLPTRAGRQVLRLRPTLVALAATDRLRLALGDADFPRLVPLPSVRSHRLSNLSVEIPILDPATLDPVDPFPSPEASGVPVRADAAGPRWRVDRAPDDDLVSVRFAGGGSYALADGTCVGTTSDVRATVSASRPHESELVAVVGGSLEHPSGSTAAVEVTLSARQTRFEAEAVLTVDGEVAMSATWSEPLRPEGVSA
ncbi:CocE/NonD family hydrolase [Cnuibacter physcomitrellae]|uniref:CocE/NonD family hydrolase n=1 Tax=Cnuibacter physcomitrellae TaxID=1619308 RepID=UPI00217616A5|nr:CocE/NonD family hydrolase [Cnuibacter physcomitrellae]MCS5495868.1 CocE/NonD family hydrolase [Cnuibacter physcomitrellae]